MTHILVITDQSDVVAQRVSAELAGRGIPVSTIDIADFPSKLSLSATISTMDNWTGSLGGSQQLDLAKVSAVYWRRPTQFSMDSRMSSPERVFAYGEARYGFGGVLIALRDCLWVNDPMAAMRAEYKPVQLATAVQAGLTIPASIITNCPLAAHAWAKERDQPLIYKPMSGIWHADEGHLRALYTSPVGDIEELLDPAFTRTAQLLQEKVPKAFEARAVVVGQRIFAVRIDADSEAGRMDWRSDYDSLRYTAIDLPKEVEMGLMKLHELLGLVYGATDLICTPDGEWVYLETNQRGEWGWLADETGLLIASAMADLLEEGTTWTR